jgi:hypothetical protein
MLPKLYYIMFFFFNLASKLPLWNRLWTHHRITTLISCLSNLTFCVVCVFNLQFENRCFLDEWFIHNWLFNVNFDATFIKTPFSIAIVTCYTKNAFRLFWHSGRPWNGKIAFNLVVKLSVELGYVFLSLRL